MRHCLSVRALDEELILLIHRLLDRYTLQHRDVTDNLLSEEVTDLDGATVVLDDNVYREMGVDSAKVVLESLSAHSVKFCISLKKRATHLCNTNEHVVDEGADRV